MRKKAVVLTTACVMVLVVVFFEFYVFRAQITLTVQANNDASISFGSGVLMFLYAPSFEGVPVTGLNFPFPQIDHMTRGEANSIFDKPIVLVVWTNSPEIVVWAATNATKGSSIKFGNGTVIVADANSFSVTLVLENLAGFRYVPPSSASSGGGQRPHTP